MITISRDLSIPPAFDLRRCAFCKAFKSGTKRRVVVFDYNKKARLCLICFSKFQSGAEAISWLEANAIYAKNGSLVGFREVPQ